MMAEKDYIELADLLSVLKEEVETVFPDRVWVKAEVSSLGRKRSGHCYLELSQSGREGLFAKVRGTIWASRWAFIDRYFSDVAGTPLKVGMEILCRAQVNFHPVYGLSLNIDEIDPEFTLGAFERKRRETIGRLSEEGLLDLQKELALPALPYSLALISAPGAAGYGDFLHHLLDNEYGFVFDVRFFPALMQGEGAPESIIGAMTDIQDSGIPFDAVLMMRGGGSDLDLACFDDYDLAAAIARFPFPVLTAIGHDKDFHVADMVANTFVKTPTALADLLLDCFIVEDQRISSFESQLRAAFSGRFSAMDSKLSLLGSRIALSAENRLSSAAHRLELIETRIAAADPRRLLEKGYLLALDPSGVRMVKASARRPGERIRILFPDGTINAEIIDVELNEYGGREEI